MTELEILLAARAKLASPHSWTKRAPGRDSEGNVVGVAKPGWRHCTSWCAYGAIYAIAPYGVGVNVDAVQRLKKIAQKRLSVYSINALVRYNDDPETTHADILSLYDAAIAELRLSEMGEAA